MGNLVLVDSSFFIRRARRAADVFAELEEFADDYDFAICGPVWLEVARGRSDPAVRARFEASFAQMVYLDLSAAGWARAAALAWELDRKGVVLPLPDLAIAAIALEHDALVLTFDAHYDRIPGVLAVSELL
jgi:predicted nucleic acid-binding protein